MLEEAGHPLRLCTGDQAVQGASPVHFDELKQLALKHVWRHGNARKDLEQSVEPFVVSGKGVWVTTHDGRQYLDALSGGSAAATLGHGNEAIARAVYEQLCTLEWFSLRTFYNVPSTMLAAQIAEVLPAGLETAFFSCSGSEAVETATQIAKVYQAKRGYPHRTKILYRPGGYHGTTMVGASASADPKTRESFAPLVPDFAEIPQCHCYRCPLGKRYPECNVACADAVEEAIIREGPETVAAVLAEAIPADQVLLPPPEYWQRLRDICDRTGVLWIDDEVFVGFGRTGRWFGFQHFGVVPDIITVSKGITGGYIPLAAAIAGRHVVETVVGDGKDGQGYVAGHTYSAHPSACAAGLAAMALLRRDHLVERADALGGLLLQELGSLADETPFLGDIRGRGLLIGLEMVRDRSTRERFAPTVRFGRRVVQRAYTAYQLLLRANGDTLVLTPALVVSDDELREMVRRLRRAVLDVSAEVALELGIK